MAEHGALATLDDSEIIERIAGGEYAAHIAPELGVSKQALQRRLSRHKEYREARRTAHQLRIDSSLHEIESVKVPPVPEPPSKEAATEEAWDDYKRAMVTWDMHRQSQLVDLARARERFRAISWRAEREFPEEWGAKTQVTGDLSITVQINRGVEHIQDVVDADVVRTREDGVDEPITK